MKYDAYIQILKEELDATEEQLYRALALSNLVAINQTNEEIIKMMIED